MGNNKKKRWTNKKPPKDIKDIIGIIYFSICVAVFAYVNPAKRNVLDLKNETCKNREKRNVLKKSHTQHFKTTKKQSKTGCFYSF